MMMLMSREMKQHTIENNGGLHANEYVQLCSFWGRIKLQLALAASFRAAWSQILSSSAGLPWEPRGARPRRWAAPAEPKRR